MKKGVDQEKVSYHIPVLHCKICNHYWCSRKTGEITNCPKCRSTEWNKNKKIFAQSTILECPKCLHSWAPRTNGIQECPKCKKKLINLQYVQKEKEMLKRETIGILDIFNSISGEVSPYKQGCLTTFVRFGRCNLNCPYCDTPTSQSYGEAYTEKKFYDKVSEMYIGNLCLTGGEPLLQMDVVKTLIKYFKNTWVETNGTIDFADLVGKTGIVADYKLFIMEQVIPYYFYSLSEKDFIKFVITNNEDFQKAVEIQRKIQRTVKNGPTFAYSMVERSTAGGNGVNYLFNWLGKEILPNTIINVQIHKYLEMK